MFEHLIELRPKRVRTMGETMVSVAVHGVLIAVRPRDEV